MTVRNLPKKIMTNSPEDSFLRDVRRTSKKYIHKAKKARHQYVRVGLCTAAFSSLIPVAAATSFPRWVVAVLGAVVVSGHGFFVLTRPHERAIHYEYAGKALRLELLKYKYCSESNKPQAWKDFVTRVLLLESGFLRQETDIGTSEIGEPPLQEASKVGPSESNPTGERTIPSQTLAKIKASHNSLKWPS